MSLYINFWPGSLKHGLGMDLWPFRIWSATTRTSYQLYQLPRKSGNPILFHEYGVNWNAVIRKQYRIVIWYHISMKSSLSRGKLLSTSHERSQSTEYPSVLDISTYLQVRSLSPSPERQISHTGRWPIRGVFTGWRIVRGWHATKMGSMYSWGIGDGEGSIDKKSWVSSYKILHGWKLPFVLDVCVWIKTYQPHFMLVLYSTLRWLGLQQFEAYGF